MHLYNPLFAVLLTLLAFLLMKSTFIVAKKKPPSLRFGTIDGLRGYLAFFVLLHHASVWYIYLQSGLWVTPESHLYAQLGQASVLLFFMITSFLFYDKLLSSRLLEFDWRGFFVGRFFRLAPLYVVVVLAVFLIVAGLSHWRLVETPQSVLVSAISWLLFTIPASPPINGVADTSRIVAGVTWSLVYEWCFYFSLPLVSLSTGQRPGLSMLTVSVAGLAIGWLTGLHIQFAVVFVGGMLAAILVRDPRFVDFCKTAVASALVLICFAVLLAFPNAHQITPCILLIVAFCFISGGADLFGLLSMPTSHRFGELAYGIYLIHGIVLDSMVNLAIGSHTAAMLSVPVYWICVALFVPVVLALAGIAYHFVELPGIQLGKRLRHRRTQLPSPPKPEAI